MILCTVPKLRRRLGYTSESRATVHNHLTIGGDAILVSMVAKGDLLVGAAGWLVALVAFDLFPGFTALLSLVVGGIGCLTLRRGQLIGRRFLDVFVGMVLALAVVLFLALVVH